MCLSKKEVKLVGSGQLCRYFYTPTPRVRGVRGLLHFLCFACVRSVRSWGFPLCVKCVKFVLSSCWGCWGFTLFLASCLCWKCWMFVPILDVLGGILLLDISILLLAQKPHTSPKNAKFGVENRLFPSWASD